MKNLNKIFDIQDIDQSKDEFEIIEKHETENSSEKVENDYEKSRKNLHDLLDRGQEALIHALEVAKQSEHPRAFEVVGNLIKQLSEINHDLVDLHTKKVTLKNKEAKGESDNKTSVTNNAIFVGSTTELSNFLQNMRKEK